MDEKKKSLWSNDFFLFIVVLIAVGILWVLGKGFQEVGKGFQGFLRLFGN